MKLSLNDIVNRLGELKTLEQGWDGYRGVPINVDVSNKCLEIIQELSKDRDIIHPSIIPSCDGGCQIEWHYNGNSLEIEINPLMEIIVWHNTCDRKDGETYWILDNLEHLINIIDNYFLQ
jgi:hypothetical protein